MDAIINIQDEIKEGSYIDVISQYKKFPNAKALTVNITSPGGLVSEGDSIHDFLNSLTIPITTIAKKVCASIATKIFLVGDVRKVEKGTDFLIHNPFIDNFTGDASQLMKASNYIKNIENDLNNFYATKLNLPIQSIIPLTSSSTYLNETQLIALGFATEIIETDGVAPNNYKAVAKINFKTINEMSEEKEVKSLLKQLIDGFQAFTKGYKVKAFLEKTDVNGEIITFPNLEPDQEIIVGETATAPKDDVYTIVGVGVIEIENGVVKSITPEAEPESEEIMAYKKQIEDLKKENSEKTLALAKLEDLKKENSEKNKALLDFEKQLEEVRNMVTDYTPEKRTTITTNKTFVYKKGLISNLKK